MTERGEPAPGTRGTLSDEADPHVTQRLVEELSVRLVQEAPLLDPEVVGRLREALARLDTPLARTISRIVALVAAGRVDPAISLPALAEACATLVAGARGHVDRRVLDAAQFQIDTLTPLPDRPARIDLAPDVPVIALRPRRS